MTTQKTALGGLLQALAVLAMVSFPSVTIAGDGEIEAPSLLEQLVGSWSPESGAPEIEPVDVLRSEDDRIDPLSLREAIVLALENNPGLAAERLAPAGARTRIASALGAFDPRLRLEARAERSAEPTSTALAGALSLRQEREEGGLDVEKLLRSGATVSAGFLASSSQTNSAFFGLSPQYRTDLVFSIGQPLLKGFGYGIPTLRIRVARTSSAAADATYRARALEIAQRVVEEYWAVVGERGELEAEREGLTLARRLEEEASARVEAGELPPIAEKEAAAEAARREERVIVAENEYAISRDRLRLRLQWNPEGTFLPREVEPSDSPNVRPVELDEIESLESAITGRPELEAARREIESRRLDQRLKRNQLLPSLDLRGSYGLNGLSGRAIPQIDFNTGRTVASPFGGSFERSLDRLGDDRFSSASGGLTLTFPLGNGAAESEYAAAQIELRRVELRYRQLVADVTLEVRRAIGDVGANAKRITAIRLARELAEDNLEQERERLRAGLSTTRDVLEFQEKLTSAKAAEVRAVIDYNVSIASLRRADGTLFESLEIELEEPLAEPTSLWATF